MYWSVLEVLNHFSGNKFIIIIFVSVLLLGGLSLNFPCIYSATFLAIMLHNFFRFVGVFVSIFDIYCLLPIQFQSILFSLAVQLEAWHQKMRTIFSQTAKEIMGMNCSWNGPWSV